MNKRARARKTERKRESDKGREKKASRILRRCIVQG